jgi:hypothetical protein
MEVSSMTLGTKRIELIINLRGFKNQGKVGGG